MPASLGPYRLQDRLGEGGMGVVHLARDPEGRLVALKVLRPWVAGDVNARRRLIREVETMRRVHSPYVAEVLDADVTGEFPYIVTRYVPGPTLDELVRRQGPLSASGVQRLATGLAEALAAIHAAGIVHRDLKPGNVMLTDDRPVVIDFGIAQAPEATRLTQTGMVMGTPGYLAPEVIEGKPSSPASDVHSWGATVAFAATGRPPYGTGSFETIFFRVISGRADLAGVPAPLVPLVSAALARDPARRPAATWLGASCRDGYAATAATAAAAAAAAAVGLNGNGLNGNGSPKALSETNLDTLTALDPLERRQLYPARPGNNGYPSGQAQARPRAIPSAPLLPPGPIGRAGIPDDPPAGRPVRAARPAGEAAHPGWLPGLAFTVAAAALTVALPVAGLIASLAVITLLRAADTAQHHLVARGPLAILLAPLTLARALLTTIMLAPFAIVCGLAGWAATIALTHHAGTPKAPAFGAAAAVICYAIGPGSRRPRRQLRQIAGALSRTPMSATAAALASWALAAAAVTIAMSQPPYFWPATAPSVPHVAVIPHLPMLPKIPSLHSLVTRTATWLTGHTRL
ncbi:MAG: serine/threonine protein kinase [Streptosporangiaceae bacterium]|nr:serine/threonine protein kinase [Streptosporangiaceae bacterium]